MSAHLPAGGGPFSLSILRTVSRSSRSSAGLAPITWRAMIEDEAWPSAQAFTSWAKSATTGPSILRSTVTVEPHSLEWAVGRASGAGVAGCTVRGEIGAPRAVHFEVDGDRGAAQLGMGGGAGIGRGEASQAGNIARPVHDFAVL